MVTVPSWRGVARIDIVEVLADAAKTAAFESGSTHPEDVALTMADAVRHAAYTIEALSDQGLIGTKDGE